MRVAIGSDHAGFTLKGELCTLLDDLRVEYLDFGTFGPEAVDYPDVIAPVARAVRDGDFELGIVLGGSGTGEAIVANKVRGIRCVEAADPVTARLGREHNDANVLAHGRADRGQRGRSCLRARVPRGRVPGRAPRRPDRQALTTSRPKRPAGRHSGPMPVALDDRDRALLPATTGTAPPSPCAWCCSPPRCSAPSG